MRVQEVERYGGAQENQLHQRKTRDCDYVELESHGQVKLAGGFARGKEPEVKEN